MNVENYTIGRQCIESAFKTLLDIKQINTASLAFKWDDGDLDPEREVSHLSISLQDQEISDGEFFREWVFNAVNGIDNCTGRIINNMVAGIRLDSIH